MQMGGSLPGAFVPVLRVQDAPLSRPDISRVLASAQGNVGIAAAAGRMRRESGPVASAVRRTLRLRRRRIEITVMANLQHGAHIVLPEKKEEERMERRIRRKIRRKRRGR